MKISHVLATLALTVVPMGAHGDVIEVNFEIGISSDQITPTAGCGGCNFDPGEQISTDAFFFPDDPIGPLNVGDTLRLLVSFADGQRLQIFDFGEPTIENFNFILNIADDAPNIVGANWLQTVTFLGVRGQPGVNPISELANGGGAGIGGVFLTDFVDNQFSFTGFQLDLTINSAISGFPAFFTAATGLTVGGDRIEVRPVPEPGTLALLGVGLFGMGLSRHRKRSALA